MQTAASTMRWVPPGVIASGAVALLLSWPCIPERWAVHVHENAPPIGWAEKSAPALLAPLLLGVLMWVAVELTVRWMRRRASGRFAREVIEVHVTLTRIIGFAPTLLLTALALALPLLRPRSALVVLGAAVGDLALVIGVGLAYASAQMRALRMRGVPMREGYEGIVYRNPRDPRLWAPKIIGFGWTLNFAHPAAWPVLVGLLIALLLAVTLTALA